MSNFKFVFSYILTFCLSFLLFAQEAPKMNIKDLTEKQVTRLDKDVNLDDFQKIEVNDIYMESNRKIKTAMEEGSNTTELRFLIENNNREIDTKLKEVLLPEQFEKYIDLKRDRAINGEKEKKEKKKKREKNKSNN